MERKYKTPPITWLKVTDYMHGWLQEELGGGARIRDQRVVSVQHMLGAREILKMETVDDMMEPNPVKKSMSGTRMNCILAGLALDQQATEHLYGITKEQVKLFVPIECPKMCMTKNGVLRPWTLDICMGMDQSTKMQHVIREAFWNAVKEFNVEYSIKNDGKYYPSVEMIEAFCCHTNTPDVHVEAMRREWQRRCKRISDNRHC